MNSEKNNGNLSRETQKVQKTSVADLRKLLKIRFQESFETEVQGPSDTLVEMVCDPMPEDRQPLFFAGYLERLKEGDLTRRRGPSRSGGAASSQRHFTPPLTSRGVTNRQSPSSPTSQPQKILGGYDGGVEIGFNGLWSDAKFKSLLARLETARLSAENEGGDDRFVTIDDMTFSANAHGGKNGMYYKYIIEGMGMKVYIHASPNPKSSMQPIRIRYGFECLAGRDFFAVHLNVLTWLENIGFKVEKETLSRVDLQVLLTRDIGELMMPILFSNQCVKRARNHKIVGTDKRPVTSYTVGGGVQLCIYDKRKELLDTRDEVKMSLLVNECLGGEFPDDLTRIEFRLRRDALKYFGINTVQDLLERENAVVDYLTFDWFRILDSEKKSEHGHERRQALHPLWQEVRDLFFEYFPGVEKERKPIERNSRRREIKCTGESLIKQAVGCIATAAALVKGMFESEKEALAFVQEMASEKAKKLFQRTRERVIELGIVRGVEVPNALDWHLDPRYACDSTENALDEYRMVWDEDLQYDRFRQTAVAGCPF